MTGQSGGSANGFPVSGVLAGSLPSPTFATNGTTPLLGTVQALLGAPVTMTSANTGYDGPSVALTTGSWYVSGSLQLECDSAAALFTVRLWDGTTTTVSGETQVPGAGFLGVCFLAYPIVLAAPTTIKLSAWSTVAGSFIKAAAANNGAGNNASFISALRIA